MILRCTEKLLKEAGLRKSALIDINSDGGGIGEWYGNLLRVGSQKCLLFTNAETLYSAVAFPVSRDQIRDLHRLLLSRLEKTLLRDGVPREVVAGAVSSLDSMVVAKTRSKSVLGSMNDYGFHIRWHLQDSRIVGPSLEWELSRRLNHMPSLVLKAVFPRDAMTALLRNQFGWDSRITEQVF